MSTKLFCVAFSLLCAGHTDAVITQIPRHKITQTGKKVTLRCHQTDDYDYMYWYRQDLGSGLRLIYYSHGVGITEKGDVSDGYNVSRTNTKDFSLTLVSATTSQTSVYFCANSESTALHSCLLSAHKGGSGRLRFPVLMKPSPTRKVPASAGATGSLPARGSSCVGSVTFMPRPTPR